MTVQLINGDCLEVMRGLPAQSVDAIITDLPYGTTACKWDTVIPFAPMWEVVKHVLKPRGVFVTTASQPFTSALVMSNPAWFRYEWIWDKRSPTGFMNANIRPMVQHENIVVFCEGQETYNPQYRKGVTIPFGKTSERNNNVYGSAGENIRQGVGYPLSILSYPKPNNLSGGGLHPTQKPVSLIDYLILTYTNPGETVLDMCAGSGTTGVAAIKTGRSAILIEKEPEYYAIAQRRIADAQAQPLLFTA